MTIVEETTGMMENGTREVETGMRGEETGTKRQTILDHLTTFGEARQALLVILVENGISITKMSRQMEVGVGKDMATMVVMAEVEAAVAMVVEVESTIITKETLEDLEVITITMATTMGMVETPEVIVAEEDITLEDTMEAIEVVLEEMLVTLEVQVQVVAVTEETVEVMEETEVDSVLAVVMLGQECTGEAWEVPGEVGWATPGEAMGGLHTQQRGQLVKNNLVTWGPRG